MAATRNLYLSLSLTTVGEALWPGENVGSFIIANKNEHKTSTEKLFNNNDYKHG
jgi:hypothetical protein